MTCNVKIESKSEQASSEKQIYEKREARKRCETVCIFTVTGRRRLKAHDDASGSRTRNKDVQFAMTWMFKGVRCRTCAAWGARTSSNAGCVKMKVMRNMYNAC